MWSVLKCKDCDNKKYICGDLNNWEEVALCCGVCGSSQYENLNQSSFNSRDIAIILGNELEAGNLHHLVNIPIRLLEVLNSLDIEEEICKTTMEKFAEMIWEEM